MRITLVNHELRTSASVNVGQDGILNPDQVRRTRNRLAPAGSPVGRFGFLGEAGEQLPPQAPGFRYRIEELDEGRARLVAERVEAAGAAGAA